MTDNLVDSGERMSTKVLFDRGVDLFEHGDFCAARRDFKEVLERNPGPDLEKKTRVMLRKLSIDPIEIVAGAAVLLLIVGLFVFFGLRG